MEHDYVHIMKNRPLLSKAKGRKVSAVPPLFQVFGFLKLLCCRTAGLFPVSLHTPESMALI